MGKIQYINVCKVLRTGLGTYIVLYKCITFVAVSAVKTQLAVMQWATTLSWKQGPPRALPRRLLAIHIRIFTNWTLLIKVSVWSQGECQKILRKTKRMILKHGVRWNFKNLKSKLFRNLSDSYICGVSASRNYFTDPVPCPNFLFLIYHALKF